MRTQNKYKILIVDDEPNMRESLKEILSDAGFDCDTSEDGVQALEFMDKTNYDLVISDVKMPRLHGIGLLKSIKENYPQTSILLITAFATVKQAVEAIKSGAQDYITKPFNPDDLIFAINAILSRKTKNPDTEDADLSGFASNIVGGTDKMKSIFRLIRTVAPTNSTVLIEGESGTGKELVADAIYLNSLRNGKPFIKVNCAAIPSGLMESELFGHVKGAFTGAFRDKKGKFELADGGTIYLDEIGDMEITLQAKILRVIQEKEISHVGSESVKKIDVRIIAATNKNLRDEVSKGNFREDLFYRINVINLKVPPLRERKDDIELLITHFIDKFNCVLGKNIKGVTDQAMELILNYDWPGNIRELENAVERAMILSAQEYLEPSSFPDHLFASQMLVSGESGFQSAKNIFEKELIENALRKSGGSVSKAAVSLGISRHSLRYQIEKLGIKKVNA